MSLDYFIPISKVAEESGNSIERIGKLCRKHGLGIRGYDNEKNDDIEDEFDKVFKYKGMMLSEYVALFGSF